MNRGRPLLDPRTSTMRLAMGVEAEHTSEGVIRLRGPVQTGFRPFRALTWLMRVPNRIEVELDKIGTWVVERLDGRRLDQLADDLAAHLKLTRREAETALADFTRMLAKRRLVVLTVSDAAAHPAPGSAST
jgi:hypothetical protein